VNEHPHVFFSEKFTRLIQITHEEINPKKTEESSCHPELVEGYLLKFFLPLNFWFFLSPFDRLMVTGRM